MVGQDEERRGSSRKSFAEQGEEREGEGLGGVEQRQRRGATGRPPSDETRVGRAARARSASRRTGRPSRSGSLVWSKTSTASAISPSQFRASLTR